MAGLVATARIFGWTTLAIGSITMRTSSPRRSVTPRWSMPVPGLAVESVTNWQPVTAQSDLTSRVRLEVAILASEQIRPVPVLARTEARVRQTVLLVSRQAEVRRHLRACLQDHPKLRLVEVNSVSTAVSLASEVLVHLIIADPGTANVTRALPEIRTILLADEPPSRDGFVAGPRQHVMQRPFSAETLAATVLLLLREPPRD